MKKRLLAFFLALVMAFTIVPVTAFAASTGDDWTVTVEKYDSENSAYLQEPAVLPYDAEHSSAPGIAEALLGVDAVRTTDDVLTGIRDGSQEDGFLDNGDTGENYRWIFVINGEIRDIAADAAPAGAVVRLIYTGAENDDSEFHLDGNRDELIRLLATLTDAQKEALGKNYADALKTALTGTPKRIEANIAGIKENLAVTEVTLDRTEAALTVGETVTLNAAVSPDYALDPTVTWTSSDEAVASVADGVVTAVAAGSATITAAAGDVTASCEVTVTEPVRNGLASLKFMDGSSASSSNEYVLAPAFDPAVKEYTVEVPDSKSMFYAWATLDTERSSSATITAAWVNLNTNTDKTQTITSGKNAGQSLAGAAVSGDASNTVTITVADGEFTDTYTVTIVRTDPTLTALSLDGAKLNETFKAATREYTATTAASSVTVQATPRSGNYTVTYNGDSSAEAALEMGENTVKILVRNSGGYENTYTLTITRVAQIVVDFDVTPDDANVRLKDALGALVEPQDGKYYLMAGAEYSYTVQKDGYIAQKNTFTLNEGGTIEIVLDEATENPNLDKTIYAQWANFRNGSNHLGITDAPTPYAPEDAELLWAVKYGSGWSEAPGSPIIVDGDIITYTGSTIKRLDRNTGAILAQGDMVGASSFAIVPPTYADGMIFVGLSGGRIQAFNARTLESLWVYTDELGGQPNCPITYKDGYIYAGFWNSETKAANFACIYTIDEDHANPTEEKLASWTYTRTGGFYWAGAYASTQYVVVGTDDGVGGYTTESASLLVFDRITGELVASQDGIRGDIRSNVSYDPQSDRVFFTSKGGVLCNAKIDWATGQILDFHQTVIVNAAGTEYAMSTCTPSVYNGRIYIGVSGDSQFGQNSGHAIAVYDLNSDGSMTLAYTYAIMGYPQTSAMVTTAYAAEDGYVYIYLPYNHTPGGVSVLKDRKGQTEPLTTTDAGYSEVFTPVSPLAQYCICSTIADEYGTIYYKNDSCYVMAITSKIESLEIEELPTAYTENEDGIYTAEGLKAVTMLANGLERDVTDYVTVAKDEEKDCYTVSYTYGFDNANYGLNTLTREIYTVTLLEGEGYTVTGETTVLDGEDYTFTLGIDYRYEAGSDFAVLVNGETVTAVDGVYTVENVSSNLEITVEGVQEKVLEPVTVYFSFSHDEKFEFCEDSGAVMALKEIEVPYFDLANYGLENFYFSSENYGDDGDGLPGSDLDPGTAEFAYGKVTMLHLYIYATEVYYCGIDPADAGQGYLADQGILGTDVFNISGSQGSTFLNNIWNYDLNLNYYLNYEYPLASPGWGSTSDQILLHDGDIVTLGHFTDWSFFNDSASIFNYIETSNTELVQGEEITLTLYHAGADMSGSYTTAHTLIDYCPDVYCALVDAIPSGDVTEWTYVDAANDDGTLTVNTSDLAPGEYIFAIAGQPGAENPDAICSTPGGVRVTIAEKKAALGDVNGDGEVDVLDALLAYSYYMGRTELTEAQKAAADVNGDGEIDPIDATAIYRIYQNAFNN